MINKGQINPEDLKIQGLLDTYLRFRSTDSNLETKQHLDDDLLAAFVENRLSQRESTPVISHLVDCSFCRHVTAELVKLDIAFAEVETFKPNTDTQPTKVSDVLGGILSRLFGSSDGAVFAHQEPEKEEEKEKTEEEK